MFFYDRNPPWYLLAATVFFFQLVHYTMRSFVYPCYPKMPWYIASQFVRTESFGIQKFCDPTNADEKLYDNPQVTSSWMLGSLYSVYPVCPTHILCTLRLPMPTTFIVCMYACIHACICVCVCVCVCIIYTYAYIHTYIHTYSLQGLPTNPHNPYDAYNHYCLEGVRSHQHQHCQQLVCWRKQ